MLSRIGNSNYTGECQVSAPSIPENWKRNEQEDVKKAIEYLYEFKEKLSKLHPVSQEVLATILRKAWCLLMPNNYPEICSNLLLQARASGCPVVTTNIGASEEFIKNEVTGLMNTKFAPHDNYSWVVEYARLVCKLATNKPLHEFISKNAPEGVKSWNEIGEEWNELLKNLVA